MSAWRPAEPVPPVADVGAVADLRPPAVVGVADEVVVVAQRHAEPAVTVRQPGLAGGVVDEDELDREAGAAVFRPRPPPADGQAGRRRAGAGGG